MFKLYFSNEKFSLKSPSVIPRTVCTLIDLDYWEWDQLKFRRTEHLDKCFFISEIQLYIKPRENASSENFQLQFYLQCTSTGRNAMTFCTTYSINSCSPVTDFVTLKFVYIF